MIAEVSFLRQTMLLYFGISSLRAGSERCVSGGRFVHLREAQAPPARASSRPRGAATPRRLRFRGDRLDIIVDPKTNTANGPWRRRAAPILPIVQIKRLYPTGGVSKGVKPAVIFAPDFCNA
jgi:hypothetical protein